jgi:uncharacterized protein (DUF1697 family)
MPDKPKSDLTVFVALLRGVNVGGNNMISMSSLRDSFTRLGFKDVASYINSGNLLFKTKADDARKLEKKIEGMLAKGYNFESKVVVRSYAEMSSLVKKLPKNWNDHEHWRYNVMFLRHSIDSDKILAQLSPKDGIEEVTYVPGTLLWSVEISNAKRTTMLKLSSQKVFQDMTVRNLNTTRKLHDLMKKMAESSKLQC